MEEWIGERWHRLITRAADRSFDDQAVALEEMQRPAAMLFHAVGGAPGVRVVPAGEARIGGPRGWLQKIAGSGLRAATTKLDADTLALPPVIAVFDDAALNRDLYLWLAALAAAHSKGIVHRDLKPDNESAPETHKRSFRGSAQRFQGDPGVLERGFGFLDQRAGLSAELSRHAGNGVAGRAAQI